jgi:AraC family transcriptional regulator, melibiose operon regulatory protein
MKNDYNTSGGTATPIGLTATSHLFIPTSNRTLGGSEIHQHTEVEFIIYEHGSATMLFGGRKLKLPPLRLTVFWGAMPHHALDADQKSIGHVLRIPMPLVLQWGLSAWLIKQLVDFQVLMAEPVQSPCPDLDLMKHWISLIRSQSIEADRIVMLEAEARLRRMALDRRASPALAPRAPGAGRLERMVETIARRCHERLRIPEVAREAGLTRAYAMRLFRSSMGMTMLEYITRQRVSLAQRLLATTDRGILDVMEACGFTSTTRFYAVFLRFAGSKPGDYRRTFQPVSNHRGKTDRIRARVRPR